MSKDKLERTGPHGVPLATPVPLENPHSRRAFLSKVAAVIVGGLIVVVPFVIGVIFFFDPLKKNRFVPFSRRIRGAGDAKEGFVLVTPIEALPADGQPRKFTVVADQSDAWNFYPNSRLGNVFLRRISDTEVVAFSEICPHLGCSVEFAANATAEQAFRCPCHNSAFSLDGAKSNPIPPRDLDSLETEVRNGEVWVKFQEFRTGISEKVAAT